MAMPEEPTSLPRPEAIRPHCYAGVNHPCTAYMAAAPSAITRWEANGARTNNGLVSVLMLLRKSFGPELTNKLRGSTREQRPLLLPGQG